MSVFCTPISSVGEIQKAEAQLFGFGAGGIPVMDIGQTLVNTIAQLSTAALEQKELVLDGLFYDIAQQALQQMVNDILKFVNSGFDGEPAFVTDLGEHLGEESDTVAEQFIYGDELSTLCQPFEDEIRIALSENYEKEHIEGFKKEAECTIDDGGGNVEAFLSGDFNAGGWSMWMETVLNPQNTAIGGYIAAEVRLGEKIQTQREISLAEYLANDGFKPVEACTTVGTGANAKEKCGVVTPGILIKDQAANALNASMESLLNADEMNEVIGALFGNLANQALTGINGLLGLGGNATFSANVFGAGGNSSYLDAVVEEGHNNSQTGANGNKIEQALTTETRVLELQFAIVKEIDAVATLFDDTYTPFKGNSCWNLQIPEILSDTLDDLLKKVPQTIETVVALKDLAKDYEEATSASAQLNILQDFTAMQQQGRISGQAASIKYDYFLNSELKKIIDTFKKDMIAEKNAC